MFLKQHRFHLTGKKYFFFFALVFFGFYFSMGQTSQKAIWSQSPSPIYSNLKDLFLFPNHTGVASGSQIIYLDNATWKKMKIQPPQGCQSYVRLGYQLNFCKLKNKISGLRIILLEWQIMGRI